jgi:hypothetical protein
VDGIRIIVNSPNSINNFNETITNLVEKVNQIAKDVFKPKCIATYPFSENFGQSKLIDSSMLRITESIVNNTAGLIQKIKDLYAQDNSNPAFVLGDFNWKRLSEHFTDESLIHLYHSIALLLKGTPMILYGDEIELKDNDLFMKWNNQINCGFSSSNAKSNQIECSNNVGMKLARGETLPRIYKKLSKLRQEPSFSWGEIYFPSDKHNNLISFVRKANGFDGYLVVANTGKSESSVDFKKLFKDLSDNARVEYFYSYNNEFKDAYKFNDIIKLNNIYLKKGEILVAKFDNI